MMIGAPEPARPSVVIGPWSARRAGSPGICRPSSRGHRSRHGLPRQHEEAARASEHSGAVFALIIGDDELERGEAQLKDLASGEQRAVSLDLLAETIAR